MKGWMKTATFREERFTLGQLSISDRFLQMGGDGKEGEHGKKKGKACSVSSGLDKQIPLQQVYFVILS